MAYVIGDACVACGSCADACPVGAISEGDGKYEIEPDRSKAIKLSINMAKEGDTVLIAGKGHEDYQIFADKTIHFDDCEHARDAVKEREGNS